MYVKVILSYRPPAYPAQVESSRIILEKVKPSSNKRICCLSACRHNFFVVAVVSFQKLICRQRGQKQHVRREKSACIRIKVVDVRDDGSRRKLHFQQRPVHLVHVAREGDGRMLRVPRKTANSVVAKQLTAVVKLHGCKIMHIAAGFLGGGGHGAISFDTWHWQVEIGQAWPRRQTTMQLSVFWETFILRERIQGVRRFQTDTAPCKV